MPPSVHTGNLDNKVLIAGTTLYLLVYAAGALFSVAMPMPPRDTERLTCPP
jgi:acetamidase/formamidase